MRCEVGGDSGSLARQAVLQALKGDSFCEGCGDGLYAALEDAEIKSIAKLVEAGQKITGSAEFEKSCRKMEGAIAARKTKKGNKQIRRQELLLRLARLARPIFEKLKKQAALLTFDDMVARACEVVTKQPQDRKSVV